MEVHLYEWSNAAQISSALLITVFFAALSRSVRGPALFWWTRAWIANVGALAVSVAFWMLTSAGVSAPAWGKLLTRACYMAPKSAFLLLVIYGAWTLRPRPLPWLTPRTIAVAVPIFALAAGSLVSGVDLTGVVETSVIAIVFGVACVALLRSADGALRWLAAGLAARAILAVVEWSTYVIDYAPQHGWPDVLRAHAPAILAGHSSFDTGAEWLIALGCVLAVSRRREHELQHANATLLEAQEELRRLADRDPLTALANRRSLPQVFRDVHGDDAALVFFDLDGFKQINDARGHKAGDQVLRRFADALVESFRPTDAVVRYGGDEFVVVARGLDVAAATGRVHAMRERLREDNREVPFEFSFGVTALAPGMSPDEALSLADEAMYQRKARKPASR